MSASNPRPTVGFAFSGASSRSVFYVGFLEVLQENDFPIDYIAAMSGAAVVAASFACGTLPALKDFALGMDEELVLSLIERSRGRGGLYNLNKVEATLRVFSKNLRFEDVKPRLGFVTIDISAGEEVVLQMGDIAKAVCASCTLPGLFQPYEWGNKQLLDGGIMNIVPGNVVRDAKIDIVIGIDMLATRRVFSGWIILLTKIFHLIKQIIWPNKINELWRKFLNILNYGDSFETYQTVDQLHDTGSYPGIFGVLNKSISLAIKAQAEQKGNTSFDCDLLIFPDVPTPPSWKQYLYLHFTDFSNSEVYYQAGRRTAQERLPELWQMLADKEEELSHRDEKVKELINSNLNSL